MVDILKSCISCSITNWNIHPDIIYNIQVYNITKHAAIYNHLMDSSYIIQTQQSSLTIPFRYSYQKKSNYYRHFRVTKTAELRLLCEAGFLQMPFRFTRCGFTSRIRQASQSDRIFRLLSCVSAIFPCSMYLVCCEYKFVICNIPN